MAEFELSCFAQSGNAYKVAVFLALTDADWAPVFVDYFAGVTRSPAWRDNLNEMGEVPVLIHRGRTLTQSGVILHYLVDQFGVFGGNSPEERQEIWRWILFDNHKFTSYFATLRWLQTFANPVGQPEVLAFLKARVDGAFAIVENHLASRPFLIGDRITIADLSLVGYLYYPNSETGYDLAVSHPNIFAWTRRISAIPGWQPPYELMPANSAAIERRGAVNPHG